MVLVDGMSTVRARLGRGPARSKRAFDVAVGSLALILLSPVIVATAVAVRLESRGPILFRQVRTGLHGRPFRIIKFRTLRLEETDQSGTVQASPADRRLTRIGAFLRRTSLDELPQLVNVLRGEMSLVGPRPHVPGMLVAGRPFDQVIPEYAQRHVVRPGMTGWAQVSGLRGPVPDAGVAQARVDRDLEYIRAWSIGFDLRIMALTITREILGLGKP